MWVELLHDHTGTIKEHDGTIRFLNTIPRGTIGTLKRDGTQPLFRAEGTYTLNNGEQVEGVAFISGLQPDEYRELATPGDDR